jgi:hypothetical protein
MYPHRDSPFVQRPDAQHYRIWRPSASGVIPSRGYHPEWVHEIHDERDHLVEMRFGPESRSGADKIPEKFSEWFSSPPEQEPRVTTFSVPTYAIYFGEEKTVVALVTPCRDDDAAVSTYRWNGFMWELIDVDRQKGDLDSIAKHIWVRLAESSKLDMGLKSIHMSRKNVEKFDVFTREIPEKCA